MATLVRAFRLLSAVALLAIVEGASAQAPVKIGLIGEFTGPFADYGTQIYNGIKAYLKQNGDVFGGRKVEFVVKDTTGAVPDRAKRLAVDAVTQDGVDILAGFGLTPNALATAPVSAEAKKPMVIMNAATSVITTRSPYIVRLSHTLPQDTQPMAQWAAKSGIKRVFVLVSDFGPGVDAEGAFVKAFTAAGGEIVGTMRVPFQNPEFAPFVQRARDANPQAIFVFLPPGGQTISFIRSYEERGLAKAGIKIIATGDLTDDGVLEAMGDATLGIVTSFHYSYAHDSPENKAFLKAYVDANGTKLRPNFMACAGYDGMAAIAEALKKTSGSTDPDALMAAFKGMKLTSPRGAIMIDPETRDIVQTVYIRRVEKVGGSLVNVEFDKFPDVKDPGK
ncbi:MAG: ABC transporter substrate-binding protein [Betaproteobacteria bacterium]|nr:MAG: ABC transporter substrate-binding protein [Betaproteobacteria bacterium]TMH63872.1 MAG: ABC transporter substrate-binding protein [Betaproteobacteria bacterium]